MNRALLKSLVPPVVLDIRRRMARTDTTPAVYSDAPAIVGAARRDGLSVSDYLAKLWKLDGEVGRIMAGHERLGVFSKPSPRILEIGAGTGMFAEQAIERYGPAFYEVYEIDQGWARWLADTYPLSVRPADGRTLKDTPDASVDVAWAVGVFVYIPVLVVMGYWAECCRVVAPGGFVAFDVMTEPCFTDDQAAAWRAAGADYPVLIPKSFADAFFESRGFDPVGSFFKRHGVGRSETLVYRR